LPVRDSSDRPHSRCGFDIAGLKYRDVRATHAEHAVLEAAVPIRAAQTYKSLPSCFATNATRSWSFAVYNSKGTSLKGNRGAFRTQVEAEEQNLE
jgi:hypothetical protein